MSVGRVRSWKALGGGGGGGGQTNLSWIIWGPPSSVCPFTVGNLGSSGVSSGSPPVTYMSGHM